MFLIFPLYAFSLKPITNMGGSGYSSNSGTIPTRDKIIIGVTIGGYFFVFFVAIVTIAIGENINNRDVSRYGAIVILLITFPFWGIFALCNPSMRKAAVDLGGALAKVWGGDIGGKVSGFWDRKRRREVEGGTELRRIEGGAQEVTQETPAT